MMLILNDMERERETQGYKGLHAISCQLRHYANMILKGLNELGGREGGRRGKGSRQPVRWCLRWMPDFRLFA